jgi:hypothetical protein
MRRSRIETLENRTMFSVTDLVMDPFNAARASTSTPDESPAIVDYIDADEISTPFSLLSRTESVAKDEKITIHGGRTETVTHVNDIGFQTGGSAGDLVPIETLSLNFGAIKDVIDPIDQVMAEWTQGDLNNRNWFRLFGDVDGDRGDAVHNLLPYLEQANMYNLREGASRLADITDGTSNTLLLGEQPSLAVGSYFLDDICFPRDSLRSASSSFNLDIWEHCYSCEMVGADWTAAASPEVCANQRAGAASGILIGLLVPEAASTPTGAVTFGLVVDPTNPNVVYLGGGRAYSASDVNGPAQAPNGIIAVLIGL